MDKVKFNKYATAFRPALTSVAGAYAFAISLGAYAQQATDDEVLLGGSVFVRQVLSDNGTGVGNDQPNIDETQTDIGLNLTSKWRRELYKADINYRVIDSQFQDDTQPDDTIWTGDTDLTVGTGSTFYQLDLSHSRQRFLKDPEDSPLVNDNSDERTIVSAAPKLRARLTGVDSLELTYNYSDVSFDVSESNDSDRSGIDVRYLRRFSSLYTGTIQVGQTQVDFKNSDAADYDTNFLTVRFDGQKRTFNYGIEYGLTQLKPEQGDDVSRPTIRINVDSEMSGNTFALEASRSVSDTSQGNGNDSFFSSEVRFDSNLEDQDQLERKSLSLSWATGIVCSRCNFILAVGAIHQEFVRVSTNDSEQTFINASLNYNFSRALRLGVSARQSEVEFTDPASTGNDVEAQLYRLSLAYTWRDNLDFAITHSISEREPVGRAPIETDTTSATLTYSFD